MICEQLSVAARCHVRDPSWF
jgi:Ni,Fe-hydrogenase III large subunit